MRLWRKIWARRNFFQRIMLISPVKEIKTARKKKREVENECMLMLSLTTLHDEK